MIFEPADEERVAKAKKVYFKVRGARDWMISEGHHRAWITWSNAAFGVGVAIFTSGMAGWGLSAVGAGVDNPLWFGASNAYRFALGTWPGLFGALGVEMGGFWYLNGVASGTKRKAEAMQAEKDWQGGNYRNHELIHVFTKKNKLDPSYCVDDVYQFAGKPIPGSIINVHEDPQTRAIIQAKWNRYVRDGVFHLILGETYERDGRFNDRPRLLRVAESGLWTGLLVIGPTGAGKSQANLLPMIDQFLGYYSWIPSELELWLKDVPKVLEIQKEKLKTAVGNEAALLKVRIQGLEKDYKARVDGWKQGIDFRDGREKMAFFLWEPKAEMWSDGLGMLKRFGREEDYIELGIVSERFDRWQEWTVKMRSAIQGVWAYLPERWVLEAGNKQLEKMAHENVINLGKTNRSSLMNQIYCEKFINTKGEEVISFMWLPNFLSASGELRSGRLDEPNAGEQHKIILLAGNLAKKVISPWCFEVPYRNLVEINKPTQTANLVGPFGFGAQFDVWYVLGAHTGVPLVDSQALFMEPLDLFIRLFGMFGGNRRFKNQLLTSGVNQGGPEGGLFDVQVWDDNLVRGTVPNDTDDSEDDPLGALQKECGGRSIRIEPIQECVLLAPITSPNVSLLPSVQSAEDAKAGGENIRQRLTQMLSFFPADRIEFAEKIRKQVRWAAPITRIPGERKTDFRIRVAWWKADRRFKQWGFVMGLLEAFDEGADGGKTLLLLQQASVKDENPIRSGLDVRKTSGRGLVRLNDHLVAEGRDTLNRQVWRLFLDRFSQGMAEAIGQVYLHNALTMVMAVTDLCAAGWEVIDPLHQVEANPAQAALEWLEFAGAESKYDEFSAKRLRPGPRLEDYAFECAGVTRVAGENPWPSIEARIRGDAAIEELRSAILYAHVVRRGNGDPFGEPLRHPLAEMFKVSAEWAKAFAEKVEGPERDGCLRVCAGSTTWDDALSLWRAIHKADERAGCIYTHDFRTVTEDTVSPHSTDFDTVADTRPLEIALGPWDCIWSEFVGERIWDPLNEVIRGTMAFASRVEAEEEIKYFNEHPDGKNHQTASDIKSHQVEEAYRLRAKTVLNHSMAYLKRVETYLRTIPVYYKVCTSRNYGYDDKGGIGPCAGPNKFNPLHAPHFTPDQLTGALNAVLNRTAGSGDTDFWSNAAALIAKNMISLLRAGVGYVTVSSLKQMCESDGFVDLVIRKGNNRLRRMMDAQGGGGQDPAQQLQNEVWLKCMGDVASGRPMPAEAEKYIPRMVSNTEVNEIRDLLAAGTVFINENWRNPTGMFAAAEVRGNSLNHLFSQLDALASSIGAFSFSPENEEELSFPTWPEVRTEGKAVFYRMNHTSRSGISNLVSGMAITGYQAMVLASKETGKRSEEVFARAQKIIPRNQRELLAAREELWGLQKSVYRPRVREKKFQEWGKEALRVAYEKILVEGVDAAAASFIAQALQAEKDGIFGGVLGHEDVSRFSKVEGTVIRSAVSRMAATTTQTSVEAKQFHEEVAKGIQKELMRRDERDAASNDRIRRLESLIWEKRQENRNIMSELEEFPNAKRRMAFVVDEYHQVRSFSKKSGGISDEKFLAESRAGNSINVLCTQSLASVKSGADDDSFNQWFSSIRIQICLGSPNKWDQEMLSDVWRGEKRMVEGDVSINVSYEAADRGVGGEIRGSKKGGVSRSMTAKRELVKWVEPEDLARVPTMWSYVKWYDGNRDFPPQMCAHVPYFIVNSKKASAISGDPLCEKPFLSLVRDGEFNLKSMDDFNVRSALINLQAMGVDISDELEEEEARARRIKEG